jgi:trehalose 2-sulfotransferase
VIQHSQAEAFTPFDARWNFSDYHADPRKYLIASTQRSGSYFLSYLLRGTGKLGAPFEYLHPDRLDRWRETLATSDLRESLRRLFEVRTSPNGWFGIKAHWNHLEFGQAHAGDLLHFEKFIRIERRDRLAQAVSLALARQTGSWMSIQQKAAEPRYDERKIAHALSILDRDSQAWDRWFRVANVEPFFVYYEDLAADPLGILNAVLAHFKVAPLKNLPSVPMAKQGSQLNEDWKRRYSGRGARLKRHVKSSARWLLRR